MADPKHVAVIGSGASGLPAIKCCLDAGLRVTCLEKSCDLGGLWRYTDEVVEGEACVMKSTVINTSKEMMSYSDFPPPAHFANHMHNKQVLEYLKLYATNFDLLKHIRFNTEVVSVRKTPDFAATGQWEITLKDKRSDRQTVEVFDGVLVCTGHHAEKYVPQFEGMDTFEGTIVHTHDFKEPMDFADKNVVVVGLGNSGGDVSVELSKISNQVYLSTRRGSWIHFRCNEGGLPVDLVFARRHMITMTNAFPKWAGKQMESAMEKRIDHAFYSLKPAYPPTSQHPTVNDELPSRIMNGTIKVKENIKKLYPRAVEFVDGSREENIDAVVLATGYSFGFPFIDKEVIDVQDNRVQLYKLMFPPDLERMTLGIIGCFQPVGSVQPISEMQARLAVAVIKGEKVLPSRADMWSDIRQKEAMMAQRYVESRRHTIQVDFVNFMDELAQMVGCGVHYKSLLFKDPALLYHVIFGPVYPYQYRLHGPHAWPGARDAILNAWERVRAPLRTRRVPEVPQDSTSSTQLIIKIVLYFLLPILLFRLLFL